MADNTPVDNSTREPEVKPEVATQEPLQVPPSSDELLKKAEAAKAAREVAEKPVEAEQQAEVVTEDEEVEVPDAETSDQTLLKKRLKGAISEIEKKNEESRRIVQLQTELVQDNPELIHKIAATDPLLANKIVMKVWSNEGIRSYKQLLEHAKLEELKETDPNLYEIKKETSKLRAELAERSEKDKQKAENSFLESKGIMQNEYDPKYSKLMEALDTVNPTLVKEDYTKALEIAHKIAFSGVKTIKQQPAQTMQMGAGTPPPPIPTTSPAMSERSTWLDAKLREVREARKH